MRHSRAPVLLPLLFLSGSRASSIWDSASSVKRVETYTAGGSKGGMSSYKTGSSSVYGPSIFVPATSGWHGHGGANGVAIVNSRHSWKTRPECDPQLLEKQNRYICDSHGRILCMPGWEGPGCLVPICNRRAGCGPHGACVAPDKCSCEVGYYGSACETCVRMPGCLHGRCTKSYECICEPGWQGPFCDVPVCKEGCQGTCKSPGECICNPGTKGLLCEQCIRTPGCVHGTCNKPFQCNCLPGWKGTDCTQPICLQGCHPDNGRCSYPGECICRTGYQGRLCNKCFTYPGCVNGHCEKPWECICKKGWSGPLCNKQGNYGPLNGTSSSNLNNPGRKFSSWEAIDSSSEETHEVGNSYEETRPRYFGRSPDGEERNSRGNSSSATGDVEPVLDSNVQEEEVYVTSLVDDAVEVTTPPPAAIIKPEPAKPKPESPQQQQQQQKPPASASKTK